MASGTFVSKLKKLKSLQHKARQAKEQLEAHYQIVRQDCPHLNLAETGYTSSSFGGICLHECRICLDCGIEESGWLSNFMTLTAPGGSWYGGRYDESKGKRNIKVPTIARVDRRDDFWKLRHGPYLDAAKHSKEPE